MVKVSCFRIAVALLRVGRGVRTRSDDDPRSGLGLLTGVCLLPMGLYAWLSLAVRRCEFDRGVHASCFLPFSVGATASKGPSMRNGSAVCSVHIETRECRCYSAYCESRMMMNGYS